MSRVALVRNRASTRNRVSGVQPAPAGVRLVEPDGLHAMTGALCDAHAAGVDVIVVDGGDGTVREVLSRIPEIWGAALPRIGIVPRGNTNLIAREVGALRSHRAAAEVLRRVETGAALTELRRPLLRIDYPSGEHAPVRGSIVGWGVYAESTRVGRHELTGRGSALVALTVFAMLTRVLVGGEGGALRQGVPVAMTVDGAAMPDGKRFIGVATTLEGPLAARMNPFWGEGPGPIRWLDILAPAVRAASAAPFLLRGKPARWMERAGYASGRARRIELTLDTPFVIDGETYPPPVSGPLMLSAAEEVTFISL
jgi:hypothetical protein